MKLLVTICNTPSRPMGKVGRKPWGNSKLSALKGTLLYLRGWLMSRIVAYTSKSWKLDIVMMIPMTDLWRKREKTGQQRHPRLTKEDWKGSQDSYLRIVLEIQMLSLSRYTNLSYHKARIFVVWKAPGNAGALRLETDKLGGGEYLCSKTEDAGTHRNDANSNPMSPKLK